MNDCAMCTKYTVLMCTVCGQHCARGALYKYAKNCEQGIVEMTDKEIERAILIKLCDTNNGWVDEVPVEQFVDYLIANGVTVRTDSRVESAN